MNGSLYPKSMAPPSTRRATPKKPVAYFAFSVSQLVKKLATVAATTNTAMNPRLTEPDTFSARRSVSRWVRLALCSPCRPRKYMR